MKRAAQLSCRFVGVLTLAAGVALVLAGTYIGVFCIVAGAGSILVSIFYR